MNDFKPGLEGVVAVETAIAAPDREGGALRYRGYDIEELVGRYPYENIWGLLVDDDVNSKMPDPEPYVPEGLTGNAPADLQSEVAHLAGVWKLQKLVDIDDAQARDDLGRISAQMMGIVARSAAHAEGREAAPDDVVAQGKTAAEKFLLRWRGEANPDHVRAIDTYWICTAEHGLNASTFTARVVASTGADCGAAMSAAVGGLSGPLHGGAPARVLPMLDEVANTGDPEGYVKNVLDEHGRIMSCWAMYASCASAHLWPSSRVIAWFCPSGSSVTMYVERFERDTTWVWTFRFPYFVPVAFDIFAASSFASAADGFSITLAASGSRNSIFATKRDVIDAATNQSVRSPSSV